MTYIKTKYVSVYYQQVDKLNFSKDGRISRSKVKEVYIQAGGQAKFLEGWPYIAF
jgi:hypothetical protein